MGTEDWRRKVEKSQEYQKKLWQGVIDMNVVIICTHFQWSIFVRCVLILFLREYMLVTVGVSVGCS